MVQGYEGPEAGYAESDRIAEKLNRDGTPEDWLEIYVVDEPRAAGTGQVFRYVECSRFTEPVIVYRSGTRGRCIRSPEGALGAHLA